MAALRITPRTYHWITRAALWSLVAIVITGASVRLTGSGLGCSDWPNCEPGQLVPEKDLHGWVEFGNRLITGLVSLAVILAVSASLLRAPRERRLTTWSLGLVAGVAAQIILGAITVLTHLSPPIVMAHFLLSVVLVWNAVVLARFADPRPVPRPAASASITRHCWIIAALAAAAIVAGTVVTAAGPHGGDEDVERLAVSLPDAARVHGIIVVALIGAALWLVTRLRAVDPTGLTRRSEWVLAIIAAQATVGYVQYFTEVPVVLVGIHIAGATALWIAIVRLVLDACGEELHDSKGESATGSRKPDFAQ